MQDKNVVDYIENFITKEEADKLFKHLLGFEKLTNMMEMEVATGEAIKYNFGKLMFIDEELISDNAFPQSIWGNTMLWSEEMLTIKKRIESHTKHEFRTCVCIFYPDGNSGVVYHSDQVAFGDTSLIPSMSLGEERQFRLREKSSMKESSMMLQHGSLLEMKNGCQEYYEHSLPINSSYKKPRINLTFRQYGFNNQL